MVINISPKKSQFDKKLLDLYPNKCIISDYDGSQCEKAHIIPWTMCNKAGFNDIAFDYCNGLILLKGIHNSFEIENGRSPNLSFEIIDQDADYLKCKVVLGPKKNTKKLLENSYNNKVILINPNSKDFINLHKYIFDISIKGHSNISYNPIYKPLFELWKEKFDEKKYGVVKLKSSNKRKNISKKINIKKMKITSKQNKKWYSVEKILDTKKNKDNNKILYLIKWKKYKGSPWWMNEDDVSEDLKLEYLNNLLNIN